MRRLASIPLLRGPRPRDLFAIPALVLAVAAVAHAQTPPGAPLDASAALAVDSSAAPPVETSAAAATPLTHANPKITAVRKVKLIREGQNVARTGPGEPYAIAGVFPKDASFVVVAKNGPWYGVRLADSETGWFHADLCREFDDISDLEFKPNPKAFSRIGSYTLAGYAGAYAFDRKSNTLVVGGRLGYYVFDRLQAEAGVGWTHVRRPAEIVESLFGLTLEAEDFHMLFYHLNVVLEILPGRQMVPFLGAGVGSSIMQGETEPSFNFGAGTTLFLSKRTAMRWEFRDYRFRTGPEDARVMNDNIEFTFGTVYLF